MAVEIEAEDGGKVPELRMVTFRRRRALSEGADEEEGVRLGTADACGSAGLAAEERF